MTGSAPFAGGGASCFGCIRGRWASGAADFEGRADTGCIGFGGNVAGTSTTAPIALRNGDRRMGGASVFPGSTAGGFGRFAGGAAAMAAGAGFSPAGFAAASAASTDEVCCSASRTIGVNASGRLGGHCGARPTRFAAAGARRCAVHVCSSRRFHPVLWPSGSSAIPRANRAATAPA